MEGGDADMINIVEGDLLDAAEDIIVHQVNCYGIMGGGVAKQIREKWPEVYDGYSKMCKACRKQRKDLLGTVFFKRVGVNKFIANAFGQYGIDSSGGRSTNYGALREALLKVRDFSEGGRWSIAIPYGIGCGLGGGDWENEVLPMIKDVFYGFDVTLYKKL